MCVDRLHKPGLQVRPRLCRWLAACMVCLAMVLNPAAGRAAQSSERVALIIGNADYQNVQALTNPLNDSRALAKMLGEMGFAVTLKQNLDRRSMNREIATWFAATKPGQTALLYFAGHGVEVRGSNYLLPVDIPRLKVGEDALLRTEALLLDDLLADAARSPAGRAIVILDACRDNPMAYGTRSVGAMRGIARVDNPFGTFVMYAAGARQTALDQSQGAGTNGLFTQVLLKHLREPGLELRRLAIKVRDEVASIAFDKYNHRQIPSYYDQMTGDFFFSTRTAALDKKAPQTQTVVPSEAKPGSVFWDASRIRSAVDGQTLIFGNGEETVFFSSKIKNTLTTHLGQDFMKKNIRKDVIAQIPFLAKIRQPDGTTAYIEGVGGVAEGSRKAGSAVFLLQSTAADKTIDRFSAHDRVFATIRFKGEDGKVDCSRSSWQSLLGFKGKLDIKNTACRLAPGNHLVGD